MKHHGLSHVALAVKDVRRSLAFYRKVLDVVPVYEEEDSIQTPTPVDPKPVRKRRKAA